MAVFVLFTKLQFINVMFLTELNQTVLTIPSIAMSGIGMATVFRISVCENEEF